MKGAFCAVYPLFRTVEALEIKNLLTRTVPRPAEHSRMRK